MLSRRASAAIVLAIALLALILTPRIGTSVVPHGDAVPATAARATTHTVHIDATVPSVVGHSSSGRFGADRPLRLGLVLLAVLAALLWAASWDRRYVGGRSPVRRTDRSRWSPNAGRAPPSFGFSIV